MSGTIKRILAVVLTLPALALIVLGGIKGWEIRKERQLQTAVENAKMLYAAGEYVKAREAFAALGLEDEARACDAGRVAEDLAGVAVPEDFDVGSIGNPFLHCG